MTLITSRITYPLMSSVRSAVVDRDSFSIASLIIEFGGFSRLLSLDLTRGFFGC